MPWIPTNEGLVVLSLVIFILFSARLAVQPDQLEGAIAWVWHYTWHVHLTLCLIHILDSVPPRRARNAVIQAYRSICRPARPQTTLEHARDNLCASVKLAVAAALASIRADGALQDARRNLASVLEACDAAPLDPSVEHQMRLLAHEQLQVTQLHYRQMGAFCVALRDSWQVLVLEARESTATSLNDPAMLLGTKVVVLGEMVARLYQAHNERVDEVIACLEAHSEPGWCAVVADLVRAGWTFLGRLVGREQPGAPVPRLLLDDARPEHWSHQMQFDVEDVWPYVQAIADIVSDLPVKCGDAYMALVLAGRVEQVEAAYFRLVQHEWEVCRREAQLERAVLDVVLARKEVEREMRRCHT